MTDTTWEPREVCEFCGFATDSELEMDMHMEIHDDDE
jgi:hypothetical protein